MPDVPVEPSNPGRYPADMESRVAVLEQIARETTASFGGIERRLDVQAAELRALAAEHRAEFRWLLGAILGGFTTLLGAIGAMLGVVAHGFHWL
ncbi:MAG TPA: hypothetical protein VME47_21020 [Acetobacteraceae bacterium]|nr:hypothetical protein [Acetobacteraceae bacterium]